MPKHRSNVIQFAYLFFGDFVMPLEFNFVNRNGAMFRHRNDKRQLPLAMKREKMKKKY